MDYGGTAFRADAVEAVKADVGLGLLQELQGWMQKVEISKEVVLFHQLPVIFRHDALQADVRHALRLQPGPVSAHTVYQLKGMREFIREEDGMGTVEIILIIVVLVGLVIIFKGQIIQIINSLFQKITSQTGTV